ncbi:hypothetical protein C496_14056 [Natronorubrum tibetense GA33]|uniref:Tubulin like n=1 Tax=Natronorubrum tibetense GA33 TaxID=1114856 RepID=L9VS34_9EURY|nr:hypothetical protein C496_14056 [Natronorubrum tibetense GA33]
MGEAGCRMATHLYEDLKRDGESLLDEFSFVGVDTKESDLKAITSKEGFTQITLDPPEEFWENDRESFSYLSSDYELSRSGGATRQRSIARYYIDNKENYVSLYQSLENVFAEFESNDGGSLTDPDIGGANVWLLNSLGGGTGSGAFPLITSILYNVSRARNYKYYLCGIGSLPRLDSLEHRGLPPQANADFYGNAYAALRELAVLIDYNFHEEYQDAAGIDSNKAIRLESEPKRQSELDLPDSAFDFYGLIGANESEMSVSYRDEMNQISANTIRFFAQAVGLEDFPDDRNKPGSEDVLFSLDSTSVRVPMDEVDEYIEVVEAINEIEAELSDVKDRIQRTRRNRDYINGALDIDLRDVDLEELGHVDPEFIRTAKDRTRSIEVASISNPDVLDEEFENYVMNQTPAISDEYDVEKSDVVGLIFYQSLRNRMEDLITNDQSAQDLQEAWTDYSVEIGSFRDEVVDTAELESSSTLRKWEDGLAPFFTGWKKSLQNSLEQIPSYRVLERRNTREDLQKVENLYRNLESAYAQHRTLVNAQNVVTSRLNTQRSNLKSARKEYESQIEEFTSERETLIERQQQRENELQTKEYTLSHTDHERYMSVELRNFETIDEEFLDEMESFSNLIVRNAVSKETVALAIEKQLDELHEPIQDITPYVVSESSYEILGALVDEENRGLLEGELADVSASDVSDALSSFNEVEYSEAFQDPFSIRFVGCYTDVFIENTSEFGTIHDFYTDPDKDVGDLFGLDTTDDDFIADRIAYPELFPEDERIQTYRDPISADD